MSITSQISSQVDSGVRNRGRQYFRDGAVEITFDSDLEVEALVTGTRQYEVAVCCANRAAVVHCTCPYFASNSDTCKHIWATLLQAEEDGLLAGQFLVTIRPRLAHQEDEEEGAAADDYRAYEEDRHDEADKEDWPPLRDGIRESVQRLLDSIKPQQPPLPLRGDAQVTRRLDFPPKNWKKQIASLRRLMESAAPSSGAWGVGKEILYIVDVSASLASQAGLSVEIVARERKMNGEWGVPKSRRVPLSQIDSLPDPTDRRILTILYGAKDLGSTAYAWGYQPDVGGQQDLPTLMAETVVPMMCRTERCRLRTLDAPHELKHLRWDDGPPWELLLKVTEDESAEQYRVEGALRRGEQELPLAKPALLIAGGLVFCDDWAARLQDHDAFRWIQLLRQLDSLSVPAKEKDHLIRELLAVPNLPKLALPPELEYEEVSVTPTLRLKVRTHTETWGREYVLGELSFDYDGQVVEEGQAGLGVYDADKRRFVRRSHDAEAAAVEHLHELGFRHAHLYPSHEERLRLTPSHLPRVVRTLLAEGWHVEAEGKLYRRSGAFDISVSSGIDWFELHGNVQFGDESASLPELLKAVQKGENMVRLGDGSFGILPEDWLRKYGVLAGLGTPKDDHLRFTRSQVGILDALLASQPEASFDEVFLRAHNELKTFDGIGPSDPPTGFVGELRGYQKDGLGWLYFLQRFGFGGCLADDMGLGKTVQVLALLESRRELREQNGSSKDQPDGGAGPSLVVVPKSIVYNWQQEAARFTPKLRVLDHTGTDRVRDGSNFHDYDVVITTYGTLRRDAPNLTGRQFDYCILDESQAIKNAKTASAKAARLVQADHRLALSGTPIENHLGELWSLFEFLNPGMLGTAKVFGLLAGSVTNPDPEARALLAQGLKPFILRRMKDQVASDLPPKTEQTLYCELEPRQRKLYDELRDHYRQSIMTKVSSDGLGRTKIQILEALLRLRQAAIHPGLIDSARAGEASAKLDMLLPQLSEVVDEGHKAIVFSQFTKMLAILRDRLDRENVAYEYLDGRTRKRREKVEHFQSDPDLKLFLISLKAGGLGLNLTAAEYVFLLDPWWNPAVEAQAIDRTHRIGQTRHVFAYRLIARDTVEEKVIELQASKRELADAIINADNSLIRDLRKEDLELLLS